MQDGFETSMGCAVPPTDKVCSAVNHAGFWVFFSELKQKHKQCCWDCPLSADTDVRILQKLQGL